MHSRYPALWGCSFNLNVVIFIFIRLSYQWYRLNRATHLISDIKSLSINFNIWIVLWQLDWEPFTLMNLWVRFALDFILNFYLLLAWLFQQTLLVLETTVLPRFSAYRQCRSDSWLVLVLRGSHFIYESVVATISPFTLSFFALLSLDGVVLTNLSSL